MRQFFWFCVSGTLAFGVDAGVLQGLLWLGLDRYSARLLSVACAMLSTWWFNRTITFRQPTGITWPRELLLYAGTQALGAAVNYASYALLVTVSRIVHDWPVLGVAAGSLAGLVVNFAGASRLVFRQRRAG